MQGFRFLMTQLRNITSLSPRLLLHSSWDGMATSLGIIKQCKGPETKNICALYIYVHYFQGFAEFAAVKHKDDAKKILLMLQNASQLTGENGRRK